MIDDAKPAVIALNIFGRTMLALPLFLGFAWTLASQDEGDTWASASEDRVTAVSLAFAAVVLIAMLVAPLNRFRRAGPAVISGWTVGAALTVAGITAVTR